MSAEVLWAEPMPPEIRRAVLPLLRKHRAIVPAWCRQITVTYAQNGDDGAIATCQPSVRYRHAFVNIAPPFLSETPANRERVVVHELVHITLAPLADYAAQIIARVGEAALREHMEAELAERDESVTQDLAFAFVP